MIGTEMSGIEIMLIPYLWLVAFICTLIKSSHIVWWCIFFAVVGGLLDYGIRRIYDKRGEAVRKYFDETKYRRDVWKGLTIVVWFIVCGVLPGFLLR